MSTQIEQMEMIPETDLERAATVFEFLEEEVERCKKALTRAIANLGAAEELVKKQRFVIVELGGGTIEDHALKMRADAQRSGQTVTVSGAGMTVNVNTGEITDDREVA